MTYNLTFFSIKLVGTLNVPNSIYVYLKSFQFVLVGTTIYIMISPFYCYFWSSPQLEISKLHMQEAKDDQGVISQVELSGKAKYHEHNKDVLTLLKHRQSHTLLNMKDSLRSMRHAIILCQFMV